jgi:hypothetical protein
MAKIYPKDYFVFTITRLTCSQLMFMLMRSLGSYIVCHPINYHVYLKKVTTNMNYYKEKNKFMKHVLVHKNLVLETKATILKEVK